MDLYPERKKFVHLVNKVVEKYIDTLLYNFNPENSEKLFDQTYSTSKTSPKTIKITHAQIKDYLKSVTYPQIQKIIDSNESDVAPDTFPVYSLSIFEFLGGNLKL
jgi:hypothetical protein